MTIMAFAFSADTNDLFLETDGNLAMVFDFACAEQSLNQMLQTWFGEYLFNRFVGMPYNTITNNNPEISQMAAEKNILKIIDQTSLQANRFCVNWNQYLLTSVNGNRLFSDEDYAQFNTKVNNIVYYKNNLGHNMINIFYVFGNGTTSTISLNVNESMQQQYKKFFHKNKITISQYVPYQPFIQCSIQAPANFIISSGHLVVMYKLGGVYSNTSPILCDNYYDNRVLDLTYENKTNEDPFMLENYEVIAPDEINVRVLTI